MSEVQSLAATALREATFVVIDVETTGFIPGKDRIVELAAVVVSYDRDPKPAIDTLVNPRREMAATEIHGVTSADVEGAPSSEDLREAFQSLVANRVVAAHNASFDGGFVQTELGCLPPFVCTMSLHTALGFGRRSLRAACEYFGIEQGEQHAALSDAMAAARVLRCQLYELERLQVRTFGDLVKRDGAQARMLQASLLPSPARMFAETTIRQAPRQRPIAEKASRLRDYLELVLQAVDGEMRAIHARVMAAMIARHAEDRRVDDAEREHMRRLHKCLSTLGWAPGE